jgi:hypothetical protein
MGNRCSVMDAMHCGAWCDVATCNLMLELADLPQHRSASHANAYELIMHGAQGAVACHV